MADNTDTAAAASLAEQVIDPEEFNRRRRFRQIHEAKRRVSGAVADIEVSERGELYVDEQLRIAHLVALYVHELLPLIEQSDTISDGDMLDDDISTHDSLRGFALSMGEGTGTLETAMRVYAAANKFYAEIGMDLDLQEEDRDAAFDYSDILQEGPPGTGDAPDIDSDEGAA